MSDKTDREKYLKVLEKMFYSMEKLESGVILPTSEVKTALAFAISSITTDLKYDLLYEETTHIADSDKKIEPTTKNDVVALDFSDAIDTPNKYQTADGKWHEGKIPTTKNDLAVEKTDKIDKSNFSQEQYKTDLQSAYDCGYAQAKNDLGVDLISRADVLKLMQDNWHTHNGDWAMQESMDDIRALPPVTPIRPKGHWQVKDTYPQECECWDCSECQETVFEKSNFCPNCGAKMVEPQESENS